MKLQTLRGRSAGVLLGNGFSQLGNDERQNLLQLVAFRQITAQSARVPTRLGTAIRLAANVGPSSDVTSLRALVRARITDLQGGITDV